METSRVNRGQSRQRAAFITDISSWHLYRPKQKPLIAIPSYEYVHNTHKTYVFDGWFIRFVHV